MKTPEYVKRAQKKYYASEKGKAWLKVYAKSDNFKASQKRYRSSEKYKQRRKDHPEIYQKGLKNLINYNVCNILTEHHNKLQNDPERLTTEFICKTSGIIKEEEK
jgi:hypothetical protein